jgi:hypothetical protein
MLVVISYSVVRQWWSIPKPAVAGYCIFYLYNFVFKKIFVKNPGGSIFCKRKLKTTYDFVARLPIKKKKYEWKQNFNNNTVSSEPRSAFANSVYFDSSRGSTATNTSTFLPNPQSTVNILEQ